MLHPRIVEFKIVEFKVVESSRVEYLAVECASLEVCPGQGQIEAGQEGGQEGGQGAQEVGEKEVVGGGHQLLQLPGLGEVVGPQGWHTSISSLV